MRNTHPPSRHFGIPWRMALAALLLGMLLMASLLAWLAWQFAQLNPWIADLLRVAMFTLPLCGAIEAGVIVWRRWGQHQYIQAHHVTELTRATVQRFPTGLQSLSFRDSSKLLPAPADEEQAAPLELAPPSIPTFAALLDAGMVGPGRPLLLGFRASDGQPLAGGWNDLYSVGIGGMTGSGKTWLVAFLVGQSAAANARLILIDPHAGDPESLATRLAPLAASYMCDVASTPDQIESALKLASGKLEKRRQGTSGAWPLLLVVDEWTSLLRGRLGDTLTATALDYAEQGRKYGCFALLAAQAWQIDAAGPVRDRLASHYTMRTRGDQFRYQMGLRGSAPLDTLFLKPGEAYFLSTHGDLAKVQIPQMRDTDLARVAALADRSAPAVGQPMGFHPVAARVTPSAQLVTAGRQDGDTAVTAAAPVTTASGRAKVLSPEAARAATLLVEGNSIPAIVKELRGVVPREGRRYMTALDEVTSLLKEAMKEA
jgi:hypothetical protein